MKIELYRGCTSAGLSVDGEAVETREQELALFERLVPHLRAALAAGQVQVTQLIEDLPADGEEHGSRCDQCGDTPYTTTWELKP